MTIRGIVDTLAVAIAGAILLALVSLAPPCRGKETIGGVIVIRDCGP